MQQGTVTGVYIAPDSGDPMEPKTEVEAVANRGLRGDRYFDNNGLWNLLDQDPDRDAKGASDVTFIETEAITAATDVINTTIEPGAHRRNITNKSGNCRNDVIDGTVARTEWSRRDRRFRCHQSHVA